MTEKKGEVAFFVTCLIDNLRPDIGFSVVSLIEDAGFKVVIPELQSCCGQPNFNGGDKLNAQKTARKVIDAFIDYEYVVIASGSCGGMIKHHYNDLLSDDALYRQKAERLANKVYELSHFLSEVANYKPVFIDKMEVTYHDACAGLRELDIKKQPRALLEQSGVHIVEMDEAEVCCGFGGAFCVKYPEISNQMVEKKVMDANKTHAAALVTGDLGCLMNMEGKLHRLGIDLQVFHYAELLMRERQK